MLICDRLIEFSSQKFFSSNLYKLLFFEDDEGNQDIAYTQNVLEALETNI